MKKVTSIDDFGSPFVLQIRTKAKLHFSWICSLDQQHRCWQCDRFRAMKLFSAMKERTCDSNVLAAIEVVPLKMFWTLAAHPAESSGVSRPLIFAALSTPPSFRYRLLFLALLYRCEAVAFLVRLSPTRCLAIWKCLCFWRLDFLRSVLDVGFDSSLRRQKVAVLEQSGPKNNNDERTR